MIKDAITYVFKVLEPSSPLRYASMKILLFEPTLHLG